MGNPNQKEYSGRILSVEDGGASGTLMPDGGVLEPIHYDNGAKVEVHVGSSVIYIKVENHGQEVTGRPPIVRIISTGKPDGR